MKISLKKKITAAGVIPLLVLGLLTVCITITMVKSALVHEVEESLRGTAYATLAAYDQNTGDYLQSANGDIWKGGYNISKSESLVDSIKINSGMDVTFFYGAGNVFWVHLLVKWLKKRYCKMVKSIFQRECPWMAK